MDELHFMRPLWLLALPAAPLLAWYLWRRLRSGERWRGVCDPELLPHLLVAPSGARRAWPFWLVATGVALAVTALAGPAWERVRDPIYRTLNARVVVLDLSRSMDAGDIAPSRLVRARFKAVDVLRRSRDRPVGLVVFAGDGFIVTPLTQDANTLVSLLPAVDTSIMPIQGSRADLGLEQAEQLLERGGAQRGEVLLITDGVKGERAREVAARLHGRGFRVSVLGIGTPAGAPIPLAEGGFLRDMSGAIVVPGTDYATLAEIARAGGGEFAAMTNDERDIDRLIVDRSRGLFELQAEAVERTSESWRDGGFWLVLPLVALAALAFRRGWLATVMLAVVLAPSRPALAFGWDDLWWRADQQAARALAADAPERAAMLARDPAWQGAALYRGGRYAEAARAFAGAEGVDASYNRGNALARAGRLEQAIAAYDAALARAPDHADAAFNRELVARLLEQQQREQEESGDGADSSRRGGGARGSGEPRGGPAGRAPSAPEAGATDDADAGRQTRDEAAAYAAGAGREGSAQTPTPEEQQAIDQWLRRVPDDPGGLLRNKFRHQHQQRAELPESRSDAW
ncbi:MAG: VWA domain-containing protein [Gammaproteobacteria bacterium]|nr:VWA domain-containing protein [Gammaproteobacteria bacterium]